MRKFYKFTVFLLFVINYTFGQSSFEVTNLKQESITPVTPDVAALGRFGMRPPDLSTGQVQVSIPVYEIKEPGLHFPINLNYSFSGFRVKEETSWLGLGWTISADAIITRLIKGAPDNSAYLLKKFEDYDQSQIPIGYEFITDDRPEYNPVKFNLTANRLYNNLEDGKPDVYVYNFNGHTGRFIYLDDKAYPLPFNDLVINKENEKFIINTPEGIKYIFEASDRSRDWGYSTSSASYSRSLVEVVSTWRLKRIENVQTNAWMNFFYTDYSHHEKNYEIVNSVTFYSDNTEPAWGSDGPLREDGEVWHYMNTNSDFKILDRIESNNTIVKFILGNRLDFPENKRLASIEVYHRNNLSLPIKKFTLDNDSYFGDSADKEKCWLKLNKIEEISSSGEVVKTHKFEYENAWGDKKGYAIDHWGYDNNVSSNHSLIPQIDEIAIYEPESGWPFNKWANREPNFTAAKEGSLKKITYPTGGTTEFLYESAGGRGIRINSIVEKTAGDILKKFYSYFPDEPVKAPKYKFIKNKDLFYTKYSNGFTSEGSCDIGTVDNPGASVFSRNYLTVTGTARTNLDEYDEETNFYSKVTESIGSLDGIGGETIYEFQKDRHSQKVFLKKKEVYEFNNQVPIAVEKNEFNIVKIKEIKYWSDPVEIHKGVPIHCETTQSYYYPPSDPRYPSLLLGNIFVGGGAIEQKWFQLERKVKILDGIIKSEEFTYHSSTPPKHTYPIQSEHKNSDGQRIRYELFHPGDFPSEKIPNEMWNKNDPNFKYYIEPIVRLNKYVDNELVYQAYNSYIFQNDLILLDSYHQFLSGDKGEKIFDYKYNDFGNVISIEETAEHPISIIWGYNNAYLIGEILNASPKEAFYTSFEEDGVTFENIKGENMAKTGRKVRNAGSYTFPPSFNPPSDKTYKMSYWYFNGDEWVFSEEQNFTRTINQFSATKLDEVRVHPKISQMTTYSYDPLIGMTSQTDNNGVVTYYKYDDFGRLKNIKDQEGNILKSYEYNYKIE